MHLLQNLLTNCPQILCHSYMDFKMGMMWSTSRVVTIAWYDLHLKCRQGLNCRRLLLCSGFNREYYQVKEATPRPWIIMRHASQRPGLFITFWGRICGGRFVHIWLSTLLPELHLQWALANLFLKQDLFSEYQNMFHVLKYSNLELNDGHRRIIKMDTKTQWSRRCPVSSWSTRRYNFFSLQSGPLAKEKWRIFTK